MCGKSKRFLGTWRIHPDLSAAQTRQPTAALASSSVSGYTVGALRACKAGPYDSKQPKSSAISSSSARDCTASACTRPVVWAVSSGPGGAMLQPAYALSLHLQVDVFFLCVLSRFPASRADRGLADLSCRAKGWPVRWRLNLSMPVAI